MMGSVLVFLVAVIAVVMQCDTVEFFERVRDLATGSSQPRIQRHALHLADRDVTRVLDWRGGPVPTKIHRMALLDISEVDGINAPTLIWYDGRLRVAK